MNDNTNIRTTYGEQVSINIKRDGTPLELFYALTNEAYKILTASGAVDQPLIVDTVIGAIEADAKTLNAIRLLAHYAYELHNIDHRDAQAEEAQTVAEQIHWALMEEGFFEEVQA